MGASRARHVSHEPQRNASTTSRAGAHTSPRTAQQRVRQLQFTAGNRAVTGLLRGVARLPPSWAAQRSAGERLDPDTQARMGAALGHDFSQVRVYSDPEAAQAAGRLNATAVTVGDDIMLGPQAPSPQTPDRQRLLAHELAHLVQQRRGGGSPGPAHEAEAVAAAQLVAVGETPVVTLGAAWGSTQCKPTPSTSPTPPAWLAGVTAQHVQGNIWEVQFRAGGPHYVGPYRELTAFIEKAGINAVAHHIVGGEHLEDLGSSFTYDNAPCVAIDPGLHEQAITPRIGAGQRQVGGRRGGRPVVSPADVMEIYQGAYTEQAQLDELYTIATNIIRQSTPRKGPVGGGGSGTPTAPTTGGQAGKPAAKKTTGAAAPASTTTKQTEPTATAAGGTASGGTAGSKAAGPEGTTAEVGAPLEPVTEATPGFNPQAGAALGGAVQALQAKQFGNLQQDEIAKYEARLAELQPKIDAFLQSGYSVELILIVEKPTSPDFWCASGVYCEQSQLVYFHGLYINYAESVKPTISPTPRSVSSQPSMSSPGGGVGIRPYTYQGGSIIDEKEIPFLHTRDPAHHCEYAKLTLYPQQPISPLVQTSRPPAQPVKTQPRLDPAAEQALAAAPSKVYILSANTVQSEKARQIINRLNGNPSFVIEKEYLGGPSRSRTLISYFSKLDQARAEALAAIVRSEGLPLAYSELSGDGDHIPGTLQIFFGRDAEKPG
jgi:hypothetical protein